MATFPSDPKPSVASNSPEVSVTETRFGDGYSQRAINTINAERAIFSLQWRIVTETQKDTIVNFIKARGFVEAFDWVEPLSGTTYKVICREYSYSPNKVNYSVSAKFEQVYDL